MTAVKAARVRAMSSAVAAVGGKATHASPECTCKCLRCAVVGPMPLPTAHTRCCRWLLVSVGHCAAFIRELCDRVDTTAIVFGKLVTRSQHRFIPGAFGSMTSFPAISLDRALEIAAAFAASSSNPIDDKTMPSGEVVPKCFSGKQLADFLRSEEAGDMLVSPIPCGT